MQPAGPEPAEDVEDAEGLRKESVSPKKMAFRRFMRHRGAVIATVVLTIFVLFVALAPITARYGINEQIFQTSAERSNVYLSPRAEAWFGTDDIGRDLYSRLIYGTRVSLVLGISTALLATLIGTAIGAVAGLRGGLFDDVLMRVTDVFLAFPFLVALLVVRNLIGEISWLTPVVGERTSLRFIVILLALFGWMYVARIVRGQVLALKEREFVEAARAVGSNNFRIVTRHLLPNAVGPILVALTLAIVTVVVAEATLGFFGFGPQAQTGATSLGSLVGQSKQNVQTGNWWMVVFPGVFLVIIALCVNILGDGLRDATDPKMVHDA
jgi:peptide/nickel transport system permease protein